MGLTLMCTYPWKSAFWMKTLLVKGSAKRKLHTANQSVQFDEEREVESGMGKR